MNDPSFVIWCLAAMAALVHLHRWLAAQNVLAVAAILGGLGVVFSLLLDPAAPQPSAGALLLHWDSAPLWIAIVLSSRSVARLILSAYPRSTRAGLDTLALSTALISILGMAATHRDRLETIAVAAPWYRAAGIGGLELLGWAVVGSTSLVLITPWLINKRNTRESHTLLSLLIWLLPGLYLATRLMQHGRLVRAMVSSIVMVTIAVLAVRALRLRGSGVISRHAG